MALSRIVFFRHHDPQVLRFHHDKRIRNSKAIFACRPRLDNTLRQCLSRLVRATLSFSKKVENHIGAIKFFICHYNLGKAAALPL
jgi:hypothetical protein